MKIGMKIRLIRTYRNMTQGELIEGITSIAFLSKVENDATRPSDRFLANVAERLGVTVAFLKEDIPADFADRLKEILQTYWLTNRLSEEDVLLLQLQVHNMHRNAEYISIFTTLIRYHFIQSRLKEAQELYDRSCKFVQERDTDTDPALYFYYYHTCGNLQIGLQDYAAAYDYFQQAEAFASSVDAGSQAKLYYNLSSVSQRVDHTEVALRYSKLCYDMLKDQNEPSRLISLLINRSIQFHTLNRAEEGMQCLEEARSIVAADSPPLITGLIHYNYGRLYHLKGQYEEAVSHCLTALSEFQRSADGLREFAVHKKLVELYLETKNWLELDKTLQAADELAVTLSKEELPYDADWELIKAKIFQVQDDVAKYERCMEKIVAHCEDNQQWKQMKQAASELAEHYYRKKAYKKSADYYRMSYHLAVR